MSWAEWAGAVFPSEDDTRENVDFGDTGEEYRGNYVPALEEFYSIGLTYGSMGTEFTGQYNPTGDVTMPNPDDVRENVFYGLNNALEGNLHVPPTHVVMFGYNFDSNGVEVGTYRVVAQENFFLEALVIGDDYVDAYALVFNLAVPFTPISSQLKFWRELEGDSYTSTDSSFTDNGDGTFEIVHRIQGDDTAAALGEGMFRWALTVTDSGGNDATLNYGDCDFGRVKWVRSGPAA